MEHSPFGGSSQTILAYCPGSYQAQLGLPDSRNKPAAYGTVAHYMAEQVLKDNKDLIPQVGDELDQDGFTIAVDKAMAWCVEQYTDYVNSLREAGGLLHIEERFDLGEMLGIEDGQVFGTADAVFLSYTGDLEVIDLKSGRGVLVEVTGKVPSLRFYALGAMQAALKAGRKVERVIVTIVQPLAAHHDGPIRKRVFTPLELFEYAHELKTVIAQAMQDDPPMAAGDHCRFCKALPLCSVAREHAMDTAIERFTAAGPVVKNYERMTPEELATVMESANAIEAWIRSVRQYIHQQMEDQGVQVPGWKLVAKRAIRKWKSDLDAADYLEQQFDLLPRDIYTHKLKSPAQVEKLLTKGSKQDLAGSGMWVKESSGTTVVRDEDSRPELGTSAERAFLNK